MSPGLNDAHNHLHDERLRPYRERIMEDVAKEGILRMVVNGSSESDWPEVIEMTCHPQVIASFGYHPWYVSERTAEWQSVLIRSLEQVPSGIGEIGLDRWIKDFDFKQQQEVFAWQLRLAAERNLPASIHCLQAWGTLLETLRNEPRPACGFVLHSFGGPVEMIEPLTRLGAYFSLPGYFAHERKRRQREKFRHVPLERLLIETDAPDQLLPEESVQYPLTNPTSGKPLNHPANIGAVYRFAAELLEMPMEQLAQQIESNFKKVFGGLIKS